MSNEVYVNGNEIACKGGAGKVIAAFPDVCLSPPSPPAGPIPIPYPDTSFSKDMKSGSKTVKIDGKEVGLKNKSFFKTSPLGDEAATRSFGGSVITHTITGKTYFAAWSMDVKVEGYNVPRHLDLTTSNHASYPGSTPPTPEQEFALTMLRHDACPCCGSEGCTAALPQTVTNAAGDKKKRVAYTFREWHRLDETDATGLPVNDTAAQMAARPCAGGDCPNAGRADDDRKSDPPCDVFRVTTPQESEDNNGGITQFRKEDLREMGGVPTRADDPTLAGLPQPARQNAVQIDHRTPRSAGGCPTSDDNTLCHGNLCANCQAVDNMLDRRSEQELTRRRVALGI